MVDTFDIDICKIVYSFDICYILKEFYMQIRHLENIIWQRFQGTSYNTKKPQRRRVAPKVDTNGTFKNRQFYLLDHISLLHLKVVQTFKCNENIGDT